MPLVFNRLRKGLVPALLAGLLMIVVVRNAWTDEDAYFGYRTVDNFVHGHGLSWNVDERVQVFTPPLWILLLSGAFALTKELMFTAWGLSFLLTLLAVVLVAFLAASDVAAGCLAIVILTFSRAFVHFSAAGLENPVSHLVLAAFFWWLFRRDPVRPRDLLVLALFGSFVALNRMDGFLLVLPALLFAFATPGGSRLKRAAVAAAGFAPFIAWEIFAIVYYGFPLANAAYAKMPSNVTARETVPLGIDYLLDSARTDPLTFLTIAFGILAGLVAGGGRGRAAALGLLLFLGYVVTVGGDYMAGRFLTPLFIVAVMLLGRLPWRPLPATLVAAAVVALGLKTPDAPILIDADYGQAERDEEPAHTFTIVDTQRAQYATSGILSLWRDGVRPEKLRRPHGPRRVSMVYAVNDSILQMNVEEHLIDEGALSDPLLARLPTRPVWRIAHFSRTIPVGYGDTLQFHENRLEDPALALFYDHLAPIVRGPIFSMRRFVEIWRMNTHAYDDLIDRRWYREPPVRTLRLQDIGTPKPGGLPGSAVGALGLSSAPVLVSLGELQHPTCMEVTLEQYAEYDFEFLKSRERIGGLSAHVPEVDDANGAGQLVTMSFALSAAVTKAGFDTVRLIPPQGTNAGRRGRWAIGHMRFE